MSIYLGTTPLADGASTALLAGKADTNLGNTIPTAAFATKLNSAGIRTVVETYKNGTSWYRIWSDGWIEQGGSFNSNSITFLKTFTRKPHFIRSCFSTGGTNNFNYNTANAYFGNISNISTTGVTGLSAFGETLWYACGY